MKRLNRRSLRTVLLREFKSLNEQAGMEAALNSLERQKNEYERVAKQDGVVAALFSMMVGLPLEGMIAASKLLADDQFRSELESKYDSEGAEAAYAHWINALTDETGL